MVLNSAASLQGRCCLRLAPSISTKTSVARTWPFFPLFSNSSLSPTASFLSRSGKCNSVSVSRSFQTSSARRGPLDSSFSSKDSHACLPLSFVNECGCSRRIHSSPLEGSLKKDGEAAFCLADLLKQRQNYGRSLENSAPKEETKFLSLDAYDGYCRQILYMVELAIGPRRQSEPRSLKLVTRSMCALHGIFALLLATAPPTSLELLLAPHAQFCCLCLAQAASATFWGFGIARMGPLSSGGVTVTDWRLAVGLLYLWFCTVALVASFKDPQTSYAMQIPALTTLLLLQHRLGSKCAAAVPVWWSCGSNRQMLLVLLMCISAALGRAAYVKKEFKSMIEGQPSR